MCPFKLQYNSFTVCMIFLLAYSALKDRVDRNSLFLIWLINNFFIILNSRVLTRDQKDSSGNMLRQLDYFVLPSVYCRNYSHVN